jgi:hypothetical protein
VSTVTGSTHYLKRVMFSVLDFVSSSGLGMSEVDEFCREWAESRSVAARRKKRPDKDGLGADVDSVYALVLHRWHREPSLLDSSAKPIGIKLFGNYPSVEALVCSERSEAPARRLARSLVGIGLIRKRRDGLYYPVSRVATVSRMHPMLVEHVSKSVARFLSTVRENTSARKGAPTLIERYTHVPDLSPAELKRFREFSQHHGTAFLAGVDDWLEPRRTRRRPDARRAGRAAGIHVFAYLDGPNKKGARSSPRAKRA